MSVVSQVPIESAAKSSSKPQDTPAKKLVVIVKIETSGDRAARFVGHSIFWALRLGFICLAIGFYARVSF